MSSPILTEPKTAILPAFAVPYDCGPCLSHAAYAAVSVEEAADVPHCEGQHRAEIAYVYSKTSRAAIIG